MWKVWIDREVGGKNDWLRTNYKEIRLFRYKADAEAAAREIEKKAGHFPRVVKH
jgi:hypothetical protein